MLNLVTDAVVQTWKTARKTRPSPSGWISGNAVCCDDQKNRGGLKISDDGGWVWHCFNCQFKTHWRPGKFVSVGNKKFFRQLGMTDQQIVEIGMEALRLRDAIPLLQQQSRTLSSFKSTTLPDGAVPIAEALEHDPANQDIVDVCEYILRRKLSLEKYYWSPNRGMNRRFVVPFRWQSRLVGWTARAVDSEKQPRYLSTVAPGYVYGLDEQDPNDKYIIVGEGVLDADCIGGCAIMGNSISPEQRELLERSSKKIIWVPDRDKDGMRLAETALDNGWMVSIPPWGVGCKDLNDAVILYGRPAVMLSIMMSASTSRAATMVKIAQIKNRILKTNG
jgi:hypothetical protein